MLRDGPLDYFELAERIDQAPFRVRAELRVMKSSGLVRDRDNGLRIGWELTNAGYELAFGRRQLSLIELGR